MSYTLGSLFDGSGGFPLAGALCGVTPIWASEVEPYPIAVTKTRIPSMKHLGDISKINGAEIDPVDIITFGSPCQDLSVAGKRAGLKHSDVGDEETTRSGLFMEAVRIIKEMRKATNGVYPRFALWENVPGAFSSNKGEDFRIVLEELIKIAEPTAVMPSVPTKGWAYADSYIGDGWSLAYRVFDAQYWGVPQRRRRIHLIADFRGECARKVLFEREGLRGYFAEGGTPWKGIAPDVERGVGANDREGTGRVIDTHILDDQGGQQVNVRNDGKSPTLRAEMHGNIPAVMEPIGADIYNLAITGDKTCSLTAGGYGSTGTSPKVIEVVGFDAYNQALTGNVSKTLNAAATDTDHIPCVVKGEPQVFEWHNQDTRITGPIDVACTLNTNAGGREGHLVLECFSKSKRAQNENDYETWKNSGVANTLNAFDLGDVRTTECVVKSYGFDPSAARDVGVLFEEEVSKTLTNGTAPGHHAGVVIAEKEPIYTANKASFFTRAERGLAGTLVATDYKDPQLVCYEEPIILDRAFYNQGQNALYEPQFYEDGKVPPLVARGPSAVQVRYIVRRLTPTECARLQGFADRWGDIPTKTELSDEEYKFWLDVRNTHAAINGKTTKDYTTKQMLTWYNKLQTDSAEYKMWGNGIALPPALYCMQGMVEVLYQQ